MLRFCKYFLYKIGKLIGQMWVKNCVLSTKYNHGIVFQESRQYFLPEIGLNIEILGLEGESTIEKWTIFFGYHQLPD
jgi:hypothetical protein